MFGDPVKTKNNDDNVAMMYCMCLIRFFREENALGENFIMIFSNSKIDRKPTENKSAYKNEIPWPHNETGWINHTDTKTRKLRKLI